jgi:hypothetical protein
VRLGYAGSRTVLPAPVYEYDTIIYNPLREARLNLEDALNGNDKQVRQFYLETLWAKANADFQSLSGHIDRGATLLVFINNFIDDIDILNQAYSWVPNMLHIVPTRDTKIDTLAEFIQNVESARQRFSWVLPLLSIDALRRPVLYKLVRNNPQLQAMRLFFNKQEDQLGVLIMAKQGRILLLPQYEDNDEVITTFLNRVLPRIGKQPERKDIISIFSSPRAS